MKRSLKILANIHPSEFAVALWSALSCAFFVWVAAIRGDDLLSRRDILVLLAVLFGSFVFFTFLFVRLFRHNVQKTVPGFLALLFGLIFVFFGKDYLHPDLALIRNLDLRVVEMDDQATMEVVWVYWAVPSDNPEVSPAHARDISFNQFLKEGKWQEPEGQGLNTAEVGARLDLNLKGLHAHQPVVCLIARNGRALVELNYNGAKTLYHLNGVDEDPLVIESLKPSMYEVLVSWLIFGIAIGGILFWLILFLLNREISEHRRMFRSTKLFVLILAFLLPIFLLGVILVLTNIIPFGDRTFLRIDMNRQYVSFLTYLKTMRSEGNDLFYSFSKGAGGDMFFLYNYYLANPLNRLVTLFPNENFPLAITILILLRSGLCGLTSSFFFQQFNQRRIVSLLFSTAYALMSFAMINAENYFFIDGMIFMPLVISGVEWMSGKGNRRKEQSGLILFILSMAAILMINFYIGYMIFVFAVIYRLFRLVLTARTPTITIHLKGLLKFAAASLIAIGLAGIVLLPVFRQLAHSPKSLSPQEMSFIPTFEFFDLFSVNYPGAYDLDQYKSGLPPIFCGTIMTFLAILFFLNNRISLKEKLLSAAVLGFFLISFHVQVIDVFWHGFSTPVWWPYRYAFLFCFWIIRLACRCYAEKDGISGWDMGIVIALTIFISLMMEKMDFAYLNLPKLYLQSGIMIFAAAILIGEKRLIRPIHSGSSLLLLNSVTLMVNAIVIIGLNSGESLSAQTYRDYSVSTGNLIQELKKMDPTFYRMENLTHLTDNDPMQFSYAGVSHYSSTINQSTMNLLAQIGISQSFYFTRYDPGLPPALDAFWGIRYLLAEDDEMLKPYQPVIMQEKAKIWQNQYALPIGFVTPGRSNILDKSGSSNPFVWMNRIYAGLSGQQLGDVFTAAATERIPSTSSATEQWKITTRKNGVLYAYFRAPADYPTRAFSQVRDLTQVFNENRYGIANLGEYQPGETITLEFEKAPDFSNRTPPSFFIENLSVLETYVRLLSENGIDLKKETSSHLTGTVTVENAPSNLFFTIPAEDGWKLLIDGKPTALTTEMGSFLGAELTSPGTHSIDLRYTPPGFIAGLIVSVASATLGMIWLFFLKRNSNKSTIMREVPHASR